MISRGIDIERAELPYEKLGENFSANGIAVVSPTHIESAMDRAFTNEGVIVVNVEIDLATGKELEMNADARTILFNDILNGQVNLRIPEVEQIA